MTTAATAFQQLVSRQNRVKLFWNFPTLLAQQRKSELGHGNSQAGSQFHNSCERFRSQHNNNNKYSVLAIPLVRLRVPKDHTLTCTNCIHYHLLHLSSHLYNYDIQSRYTCLRTTFLKIFLSQVVKILSLSFYLPPPPFLQWLNGHLRINSQASLSLGIFVKNQNVIQVLFTVHLFSISMTNSNECTPVLLYYFYRAPICFSLQWPSSGSRSYYKNIKLICYSVVPTCLGLITW
jgi:hypothetical protein